MIQDVNPAWVDVYYLKAVEVRILASNYAVVGVTVVILVVLLLGLHVVKDLWETKHRLDHYHRCYWGQEYFVTMAGRSAACAHVVLRPSVQGVIRVSTCGNVPRHPQGYFGPTLALLRGKNGALANKIYLRSCIPMNSRYWWG